jgi:magnesium chelatase family protein
MNPCKCGGSAPGKTCRRGPRCASDYQARVSGPFLDRIDLQIEMPPVSAADLVAPVSAEDSATVRARVTAARERQRDRYKRLGASRMRTNADCSGTILESVAMPDEAGLALLRQASEHLQLSARGFHRTLRVARTLADLDGVDGVGKHHVAEALSYRGESLRRAEAA